MSDGRWTGVRRWFRLITRRRRVADDVALELQHHLAERIDLLIEEGLTPAEARREAYRRFGDLGEIRETCEEIGRSMAKQTQRTEIIGSVIQDLRYAARSFRTQPGFVAAVVLTLGLGIGANTAIFTVVDAALIRPAPFADPDRLASMQWLNDETQFTRSEMPWDQAIAWRREMSFTVSLHARKDIIRTDGDAPVQVRARGVSADLFETLGVPAQFGRTFDADDARSGSRVVVLSDRFWRGQMGADPTVIGRPVELDQVRHTILGVMPPDFKFPTVVGSDVYLPLSDDGRVAGDSVVWVSSVVRLPDGSTMQQVQDNLDGVAKGFQESDPKEAGYGWRVQLEAIDAFRANQDVTHALWVLMGAVGLMLLIAVVNGINLLLVRGTTRGREMAVRLALGASRGRLLRQLLTESVLLASVSGAFAVLLAKLAVGTIIGIAPSELVSFSLNEFRLDGRVMAYAFALAVLIGIVFGMAPGLRLVRRTTTTSVRGMDVYASGSRATGRTRSALVAAEVALSMTLLVGAALLINSFVRLVQVDPGFNADDLILLMPGLSERAYPDAIQRWQFFTELQQEIDAMPGVRSVSMADGLPPNSSISFGRIALEAEGKPVSDEQPIWIPLAEVDTAFLRVMEIPLIAGRNFRADDTRASGHVLIDEDLARFLWGADNPIGRRFRFREESPWRTVIGVVGDVKLMGQDDRRGRYDVFYPLDRGAPRAWTALAIRTDGDPGRIVPMVRSAVHRLDPHQPIAQLTTAREAMAESVDKPRFLFVLMTTLAGVAVALAGVGVYGVLSFAVSQRSREIGIRVALGARRENLLRMILGGGLRIAGLGIVLGLAGSVALSRFIQTLLFDLEPTDPLTLAGVAAVMFVTALLACYLPARRATRVDPLRVLRVE